MSKPINLPILLSCTALAFAAGWFVPKSMDSWHAVKPEQPQQAGATSAATAAPATAPSDSGAALDPLSQFKTIDWSVHPAVGADKLAPALASSGPLRTAALERFRQEPKGITKVNLAIFLTTAPLPEISAVAAQWAQQADSASARADGFELLGRLPDQQLTYRLTRQALEQEKDPQALAAAVWNMSPQGIPDPAQVQQVVPRLHALTKHPLADVRSASIQRIAEWDRARRYATQDVLRLLSDPDEEVRMAALGAVSIASLTEDTIKQRLMEILGDAKQDAQMRSIVALNLERFGLSPKEYATYQAVQRELFGKEGAK
jgi:hypothetical protein